MGNFVKGTILILHLMMYEVTLYTSATHRDLSRATKLTE